MSTNLNLGNKFSGAILDKTEKYRYSLWRVWDANDARRITFIMLNPSTADHEENDNTINKCIYFSKEFGGTSLEVVNLFAYRSTDPKNLKYIDDPVGQENDKHILGALNRSQLIIAAWGKNGALRGRNRQVMRLLESYQIHCLKILIEGHPGHPLYLRNDSQLLGFPNRDF